MLYVFNDHHFSHRDFWSFRGKKRNSTWVRKRVPVFLSSTQSKKMRQRYLPRSFLLSKATATRWAATLDRRADWGVLRAPGVLYDICKEEVGKHDVDDFLQKAFVRARHRMKQRRMVGMKSAMQVVLGAAVKPEVSIITGGPSVGKSLLLSQVGNSVDGPSQLQVLNICSYGTDLSTAFQSVKNHVEECESRAGKWPVVIVDRAHRVFSDTRECETTKSFLQLLLALSKEQRRMSVLLGTSDDMDFGARLSRSLGFDSVHLHSIHIGEAEPADTLNELMNEWGLGPDTSAAIADVFGGHLLTALTAVGDLSWRRHEYCLMRSFPGETLGLPGAFRHHRGRRCFLEALGEQGVVDIGEKGHPDVMLARELRMGDCVSSSATLVNFSGNPSDLTFGRAGGKFFLPTCQYQRTAIMMHLFSKPLCI
jgi:hypothetical protein